MLKAVGFTQADLRAFKSVVYILMLFLYILYVIVSC